MYKTPFSDRCKILGELWLNYREEAQTNEEWKNFFEYNDVSLPLAYLIWQDMVTPSKSGEAVIFVDETWEIFCDYLVIDPIELYEDLSDAFDKSSQPELNNEG
jgi:hypothetical protein